MTFGNQGQMGFQNPSQITTNTLIINTAGKGGLFIYYPSKATGNLIFSVASTTGPFNTGTSPTGDTVYQGAASYIVSGSLIRVCQIGGGQINLFTSGATSQAPFGAFSTGQINVVDSGSTSRQPGVNLKSPRSSVSGSQGVTYLILWGQSNDSTQPAGVVVNQHGAFTPLNASEGQALLEMQTSPGSVGEDTLVLGFCNINTVTDTHYRWYIDPNGLIAWGPGNATQDTKISRLGASALGLQGAFYLLEQAAPSAIASYVYIYADTVGDIHTQNSLFLDSGFIQLPNNAVPSAVANTVRPFASSGHLKVEPGDGTTTASTEVIHVSLPSTNITAVTPAVTNIGSAVNVVSGVKYKFHIRGTFTGAAAGVARITLVTPAVSSAGPSTGWFINNGAPVSGYPVGGVSSAGTGPIAGGTMSAISFIVDFMGEFTPSANGTAQVAMNTSVAADSFTFNGGTLEIWPEV